MPAKPIYHLFLNLNQLRGRLQCYVNFLSRLRWLEHLTDAVSSLGYEAEHSEVPTLTTLGHTITLLSTHVCSCEQGNEMCTGGLNLLA